MLESSLARKIVLALRSRLLELEKEPDTNLGSIGWLLDRCDDTLGLTGDVDWGSCASLRQLKKDVVDFNDEFPGRLDQDLLDALENVPAPEHGYGKQPAEVPALKDPGTRKVVEALLSRVSAWKDLPDDIMDNKGPYIRGWSLRCENILRTGDDAWCKLALERLKKDVAMFNEDEPYLFTPELVEAIQNMPVPD